MPLALRLSAGLLLVAAAIALVVTCLEWGTELNKAAVMLIPGEVPPTGLYAAPWLVIHPSVAQVLGVGMPIFLLTLSVWVLTRCRFAK